MKNKKTFLFSMLYVLAGIYFGVVLIKSELVSWFRIQEMFRFHSFHMYGVIGSAVLVGSISIWILRKIEASSLTKETISISDKTMGAGRNYLLGGTIFGFGWALTGACPGPLYALLGAGVGPIIVVLFAALLGAWSYGQIRSALPH